MNRLLPPPNVLNIFIRNRLAGGWTHARIAEAIRHRLRLDAIDPVLLDNDQRQRYDATLALLVTLEQSQPQ